MPTRLTLCLAALLGAACSNEAAKHSHFEKGQQYLQANQLTEAIIEFRNAVQRDERWGDARLKLADAYEAAGQPERAYREYLRAADLLPEHTDAQLKATAYLLLAAQYSDAKSRIERVLANNSRNVDAQIALSRALVGLGDLDGAVTRITEAIQLAPRRGETYLHLARIRVAQGRPAEAMAAFDKAIQADPASIGAHLALADFHSSRGEVKETERSLQRAFALDAANVQTNRVMAAFYMASDQSWRAGQHLKAVADLTRTPDAQFTLADYLIADQQLQAARTTLLPLVAQEETRVAAETRLASIAYSQGLLQEGHRLLDAVLEREPNTALALVFKARWLLAEGQPEGALDSAKAAVANSPDMISAHSIRAEAEARTHRTGDAIKSLVQVLRLNPGDADARIRLSGLHLARNEVDSAVQLAEGALINAPESVQARLSLVRAHIARDDLKLAGDALDALKKQVPSAAEVWVAEGALRMRSGNRKAARTAFVRALTLDGSAREALIGITTLDVLENNVNEAATRLESHLVGAPDDPALLLISAKAFYMAGNLTRAEELLRRSITLDPLDVDNFSLLVRVLSDQKQLDSAARAFDEAARLEPRNLSARLMSAVLIHAQGKLAEAKTRYEEILKLESRAPLAANNLAVILAEGDDLPRARQLAESAAEQLPTHAAIRDTLGWVYYQQERYGLAIRQLRQSVDAEPNNSTYQYHLGLAYAKGGDRDRARLALRNAVRLNPRFTEAQIALSSLGL